MTPHTCTYTQLLSKHDSVVNSKASLTKEWANIHRTVISMSYSGGQRACPYEDLADVP